MSSVESDDTLVGSDVNVRSTGDVVYVKSEAASAAGAYVVLMTYPEQDASLPPPLEDGSTSEEFQKRRRKLTSK